MPAKQFVAKKDLSVCSSEAEEVALPEETEVLWQNQVALVAPPPVVVAAGGYAHDYVSPP